MYGLYILSWQKPKHQQNNKNKSTICFHPYTDVYSALYTWYFSKFREYRIHMQITWVGFKPMTFARLEQMFYY